MKAAENDGQPRRRGEQLQWWRRALDGGSRRRAVLFTSGAVVFVAAGWIALEPVARWLAVDARSQTDVDSSRSKLIDFLALGAAAAALLNWFAATKQRTRDMYISALELLGSSTGARRAAGVYALERIMRDEPQLHKEIVDILGAIVQENARDAAYELEVRSMAKRKVRPRLDVQAALVVLGRRQHGRMEYDLRMSDVFLQGVNLRGAFLADVSMRRADLTDGSLEHVILSNAELRETKLVDADLDDAVLTGAQLVRAQMTRAKLPRADLTGANLKRADLTGADLTGANLKRADLTGADLTGADLTGAHLSGAAEVTATVAQLDAAHCTPTDPCATADLR